MNLSVVKVVGAFMTMYLISCAQTSTLKVPDPPIPGHWPGTPNSLPQSEASVDAASVHWSTFFSDPRLQALIRTSLANNRDLRIAAARVVEARAQFGVAQADQLPSVSILGAGNFTRTPANLTGTSMPEKAERFDLGVSSLSFEVDFWGRLSSLSAAARNNFLSTAEAHQAVQLSLVADIASAYFTQLHIDDLAEQTRKTLHSREQSLTLIGKGKDIGATDDFMLQQAVGLVQTTRASLAALAHQQALATNRLNYLVGEVPRDLPSGRGLGEQGVADNLFAGIPAAVLVLRPDVIAAEFRLKSANANIAAARAAFFPKVVLGASIGLASQGLAGLFSGGAWAFQPVVSAPLFDGGRTAANLDVAKAREVVAVAEYERTIQSAFREVADLLSARTSLERQHQAYLANSKVQERRLQISEARFNAGLIGYLDVLDMHRDLLLAEQVVTQVRRAQLETTAQLYKALGGGRLSE